MCRSASAEVISSWIPETGISLGIRTPSDSDIGLDDQCRARRSWGYTGERRDRVRLPAECRDRERRAPCPSRSVPREIMLPGARREGGMERALFGREAELALVSTMLEAVPSGPAALILGGDPGIGKSTLWLEALSQARGRSFRLLACRPNESEAKLSFAALGDLLEGVDEEAFQGLPLPQRSA